MSKHIDMEGSMRIMLLVGTACMAVLASACIDTPSKPEDKPQPTHVDVSYIQFVLSHDDKTPVDLSNLPIPREECGGTPARGGSPGAGGVGSLTAIATSVIGSAVTAFVKDLKGIVDKEIAKYSVSQAGKPVQEAFYDPALWRAKPSSSDRYSCFVIMLTKCNGEADAKASCPVSDARIVLVGQFRLTNEYLQVRPLYGTVKGFGAKLNPQPPKDTPDGKKTLPATIAATLKFDSVWWDGHQGHSESPESMTVLSAKFAPSPEPYDLKVLVDEKDATGKATLLPAPWETLPLFPRPPQTANSYGTVKVTATVAEANAPPSGLKFLQKVLGDDSADISSALKTALSNLVPKKL
jgi:hypothetical protein